MPGIQVFRLSSQRSNATDALPGIVAEFHPYKAFLVFNELEKLAFDPSSSAPAVLRGQAATTALYDGPVYIDLRKPA